MSDPKPLLIGEANPYGNRPEFALYPLPPNASGGRLARILGLSRTEYLRRFDRVNLCCGPWRIRTARAAASDLRAARGTPLVLLGAKVCSAFGLPYAPFTVVEGQLYLLPHPSGLNRAWADREAVPRARHLLGEFLLPAGASQGDRRE